MRPAYSRVAAALIATFSVAVGSLSGTAQWKPAFAANSSQAAQTPGVFPLQNGNAERIATILRTLYGSARILVDHASNSIVAFASPNDIAQMRGVVTQLDVRGPSQAQTTAISIKSVSPASLIPKLRALFSGARFSAGPNKSLLVDATPTDLSQIKDIVAAIDVPPVAPTVAARTTSAVKLDAAQTSDVVRILASQIPSVRVASQGDMVLLSGPSDAVKDAKALIAQVDQPAETVSFTQIYRLRSVDAQSVADLLKRSFPSITVSVETDLNAITVFAAQSIQTQIATAVERLDGGTHIAHSEPSSEQPGYVSQPLEAGDGQTVEVTSLRAAVPAAGTAGGTTTAQDIATSVQSALSRSAPGLHITVPPNSTQLILTGTSDEIRLGKELIDQLDVTQKLVVLDTQILEVDESASKNLGLMIQTPAGATAPSISTTISENVPTPQPNYSSPPQFLGLLPFTRTGLSIGLQLGLLVQHGDARILADPRITTISGRTASIRAGDNITVQTQAGGGTGTVATTTLQTFQTGVSLDITPVIDANNFVTLTLHPVVNNLSGYTASIPQISTRDTQTTVGMRADQTLIIGGLIEDSETHTDTKIPGLGDLPLVGRLFRNTQFSRQRNELVITVTPHIIDPSTAGDGATLKTPSSAGLPTPEVLPTLEPGTLLPTAPLLGFQTSKPFVSSPIAVAHTLPAASASPSAGLASPHPVPTPSAFANANVFTYGSAPQNSFALPTDQVKIYFATLAPTIMKNNVQFSISAITSSNVSQLILDTNSGPEMLAHTGSPGMWQSSIVFQGGNVPPGETALNFVLIATKEDGSTQRLTIPVSYSP